MINKDKLSLIDNIALTSNKEEIKEFIRILNACLNLDNVTENSLDLIKNRYRYVPPITINDLCKLESGIDDLFKDNFFKTDVNIALGLQTKEYPGCLDIELLIGVSNFFKDRVIDNTLSEWIKPLKLKHYAKTHDYDFITKPTWIKSDISIANGEITKVKGYIVTKWKFKDGVVTKKNDDLFDLSDLFG